MLSLCFCLVFSVLLPISRGKQLSAAPDSSCQFSVHREGPDGPIVVGIHLSTDYQSNNYMFRFFFGWWALLQNSLFIPAFVLLVRFKLHCQWFINQVYSVDSNHRCEWLQSRHFPFLSCSGIAFSLITLNHDFIMYHVQYSSHSSAVIHNPFPIRFRNSGSGSVNLDCQTTFEDKDSEGGCKRFNCDQTQ